MNKNELMRQILKSLNADHAKDWDLENDTTTERKGQYDKILSFLSQLNPSFNIDNADKLINEAKKNGSESAGFLGNLYLDELINSNPELQDLKDIIQIVQAESSNTITRTLDFSDHVNIVFDNYIMTFLWKMNKAHYYGLAVSEEFSEQLFVNNLVYYGVIANKDYFNTFYSAPEMPPHDDIGLWMVLGNTIKFQELFIIAHEIGHVLINRKMSIDAKIENTGYKSLNFFDLAESQERNIDIEIEADKIGFNLAFNTINKNNEHEVKLFCISVFLFIRYMMWSSIAFKIDNNPAYSPNFEAWLYRNSSIRKLIDQASRSIGGAAYIIDLLESLEASLEPAALKVNSYLKSLKENDSDF